MTKASTALPPGQIATTVLPRIGERDPEPFDAATWTLTVTGLVHEPLALTFEQWSALPHEYRSGTIHCVTRWSRPGTTFRGVPLAALLERARPQKGARFVRFASGRGHDTTLPLAVARSTVLLADGLSLTGDPPAPLPPEHGGPLRSVCFERYFYKSVKWLRRVELLAEDRLGTWERTAGYHNRGDPWREERYVTPGERRRMLRKTGATPELGSDDTSRALARLMAARDLSGHDLLGVDLAGADLAGFRLEATILRGANLRGADLRGADLRGANLCNADLREADLGRALIDDVDLDGADLRGADLRGTRGIPASLAAVILEGRLAGESEGDALPPCRAEGLDWRGVNAQGLLPTAAAFLASRGVLDAPCERES